MDSNIFKLDDLLEIKTNLVLALLQPINAYDNDHYEEFQMTCSSCTGGCTSCYGTCQGAMKA